MNSLLSQGASATQWSPVGLWWWKQTTYLDVLGRSPVTVKYMLPVGDFAVFRKITGSKRCPILHNYLLVLTENLLSVSSVIHFARILCILSFRKSLEHLTQDHRIAISLTRYTWYIYKVAQKHDHFCNFINPVMYDDAERWSIHQDVQQRIWSPTDVLTSIAIKYSLH